MSLTIKKLLSILLSILLVVVISPILSTFAVEDTGDGFEYIIENGEITITGCENPVGSITIPSTIKGYPVTNIGESSFYQSQGLTSIIIPDSVKNIEESAFQNCRSLTTIKMSNNIVYIGGYAFADCISLSDVTIPNSLTDIGYSAFGYCTALKKITVPECVRYLSWAFDGCTAIENIIVSNDTFTFSIFDDNATIIDCVNTASGKLTIPSSIMDFPVTNIGRKAFSGCVDVTEVIIPNSITNIGDSAFKGCVYIKSVTFLGTQDEWNNISIQQGNDVLYESEIILVESLYISDISIFEETNGQYFEGKYLYNNLHPTFTLKLSDGNVISSDYSAEINGNWYYLDIETDSQYLEPWTKTTPIPSPEL